MDYTELNRALDTVDEVFNTIQKEYQLEHQRIERWSWGQPQITLIWRGRDGIWRNIHTAILNSQGWVQLPWQIEVNAWRDMKEDHKWIRYWQYHPIVEQGQVEPNMLWDAYKFVAQWTESELNRGHPLSEATGKLLETQIM